MSLAPVSSGSRLPALGAKPEGQRGRRLSVRRCLGRLCAQQAPACWQRRGGSGSRGSVGRRDAGQQATARERGGLDTRRCIVGRGGAGQKAAGRQCGRCGACRCSLRRRGAGQQAAAGERRGGGTRWRGLRRWRAGQQAAAWQGRRCDARGRGLGRRGGGQQAAAGERRSRGAGGRGHRRRRAGSREQCRACTAVSYSANRRTASHHRSAASRAAPGARLCTFFVTLATWHRRASCLACRPCTARSGLTHKDPHSYWARGVGHSADTAVSGCQTSTSHKVVTPTTTGDRTAPGRAYGRIDTHCAAHHARITAKTQEG